MDIHEFYSNITLEDLINDKVLNEFKEKGLIKDVDVNQVAQFTKSVEVKPTN